MTNATIPANVDGETIRFATGPCSLGLILAATSKDGLCAVLFGDESSELARDLRDRFPHADLIEGGSNASQALAQIVGFTERPTQGLDLPLDLRGTPFQQRVWQALRDVPAGATVSYGEIATNASVNRGMRRMSPRRARRTRSRWPFLAIGSCARTAPSRVTGGVCGASAPS